MPGTLGEADAVQKLSRPAAGLSIDAAQLRRKQNVFLSGESWHQLIGLKHEADLPAAHSRQSVFSQMGYVGSIEDDAARCDRVQPRHQAQERAFAAAGGAHDGKKLAARN
jgi:hypothetical protein